MDWGVDWGVDWGAVREHLGEAGGGRRGWDAPIKGESYMSLMIDDFRCAVRPVSRALGRF